MYFEERCICISGVLFSFQTLVQRLQSAWLKLQMDVNCFMDSDSDKRKDTPNGIKQVWGVHACAVEVLMYSLTPV